MKVLGSPFNVSLPEAGQATHSPEQGEVRSRSFLLGCSDQTRIHHCQCPVVVTGQQQSLSPQNVNSKDFGCFPGLCEILPGFVEESDRLYVAAGPCGDSPQEVLAEGQVT